MYMYVYIVCAHTLLPYPIPSPAQDVDQRTGEDLNPTVNRMLRHSDDREEARARNPDRPSNLASVVRDEESGPARGMTRMTSPEKWEIKQLIAAGVLEKSDYPGRLNDFIVALASLITCCNYMYSLCTYMYMYLYVYWNFRFQ